MTMVRLIFTSRGLLFGFMFLAALWPASRPSPSQTSFRGDLSDSKNETIITTRHWNFQIHTELLFYVKESWDAPTPRSNTYVER